MRRAGAVLAGALAVLAAGGVFYFAAGPGEAPGPGPATVPAPLPAPAPERPPPPEPADPLAPLPAGDGAAVGFLVRAGTGEPMRGRVVCALRDGRTYAAEAGGDGWFRVEGLPRAQALAVEASAPGLLPYRDPRAFVPRNGDLELGAVRLGRGVGLRCRVLDAARRPVAGATVSLHRPAGESDGSDFFLPAPKPAAAAERTGDDGLAALGPVAGGDWVLRAAAEGFAAERREVHLAEGLAEDAREVVLLPAHALGGTVLHHDGSPAAGVVVTALHSSYWWDGDAPRADATADDAGRFRLDGLRAGRHQLSVRSGPGVQEFGAVVEVPRVPLVEIRLPPRSGLEGVVLDDATGSPVAGARLSLSLWPPDRSGVQADAEVRSGEDGRFLLRGLPVGLLGRLRVEAEGFLAWPDSLTPEQKRERLRGEGETVVREVRLHRGAEVRGTVRTADGRPVPRAWVHLIHWNPDHWFLYAPVVHSDADGAYRVPAAHPGRTWVQAGARGLHGPSLPSPLSHAGRRGEYPEACSVEVPRSGSVVKDLVLLPDGRIEGTVVRPDGTPAAGFLPRLVAVHEDWEEVRATGTPSAADGAFALEEVLPWEGWVVTVEGHGGARGRSDPLTVVEGTATTGVVIRLAATATLAGRVVRRDGEPLEGASLRVVSAAFDPDRAYRWYSAVDEAAPRALPPGGEFRVEGLSPGTYTLWSAAAGCAATRGPQVELAEGEERTGVLLELPPEGRVAGVAVLPDGAPVSGASVRIWPAGEPRHPGEEAVAAVTDAEGRFACGGLGEGSHQVRIAAPGLPVAALLAEPGAEDLRVVLGAAFAISGRVLDADTGEPAVGVPVEASREDGPFGSRRDDGSRAVSGPDGSFTLGGLRAGSYGVTAGDRFGRTAASHASRTVHGVEAGTEGLEIRVEKGFTLAGRVVDPEGNPVLSGGLEVEIRVSRGGGGWFSRSRGLGADGAFAFHGLGKGTYTVSVGSRSFGEEQDSTWIGAEVGPLEAGTGDLEIRLRRGLPISGRVVDGQGRVPEGRRDRGNLWLHVQFADSGERVPGSAITAVEADGTFRTPALEPGRTFTLSVEEGEYHGVAREVPAGASGVVVRPEVRTGVLSGRVVDGEGNAVPAGVPVTAEPIHGSLGGGRTETLDDGAFLIEGLPNTRFRVTAGGPGSDFLESDGKTEADAGARDLVIRVRRGHTLRGVLREPDGSPLNAILLVTLPGEEDLGGRIWSTEEDGTFEIRGLPAGEVVLRVQRFGVRVSIEDDQPVVARFTVPCGEVVVTAPAGPKGTPEADGE